ncbi:MAG TPA: SprT-like domain-containing protein [Vicinamibacterales bacterium]|nr:SprT-like domain-containing protein [Vicinamibacterales bacterium]
MACPRCNHENLCPPSTNGASTSASDASPRSSWTRLAAAGLAVAAIAWAGWSAVALRRADDEDATPVSPVEARQKAILKDDLGRAGDADLIRQYRDINTRYFAGRLPVIPVMWEPKLAEVGTLGPRPFTLEGMFGHVGARQAILLNDRLRSDPASATRTLCHEMVHAYLYEIGDRTTDHGAAFQAQLKRLSDAGAFTGIVATEDERRALKTWLDDENARLDAEGAAVQQEDEAIARDRTDLDAAIADMNARLQRGAAADRPSPAEIDALESSRQAFNARVTAIRARANDARVALAEFNRQVERYNLMLVYPDGLDEASLVTAKDGSP